MSVRPNGLWLALLGLLLAPAAQAAESPWQPALLPQAQARELHSEHTGRSYRIYVSQPQGEAPAEGFPVIYVLDGNLLFPQLALQARMRDQRALREGWAPVLVVGIGYPTDELFDLAARAEDYTPPGREPGGGSGARLPGGHGGAERFLAFIETELKPQIEARYPVDRSRQTLFGHSYGGLFTLYTLFSRPQAFQNYLAASPSLWWSDRQLFEALPAFRQRLTPSMARRLLLTVGAAEQPAEAATPRTERERHLAERRMVGNVEALQAVLQPLAGKGLSSELLVQPGEDHAGNAFFSALRALDFAAPPP